MIDRRIVTVLSMAVAAVAVVVMAVWGVNALTAPLEEDEPTSATDDPGCPPEDQQIKEFIRRGEVTVSVYNTGKRSGRAQDTLEMLEEAGFKPGEIGNGGEGDKVRRAEVRTTVADDPKAQLVALALGKNAEVVVTEEALGPGVDVFIGDKFGGLDPNAAKRIKLAEPVTTCQ